MSGIRNCIRSRALIILSSLPATMALATFAPLAAQSAVEPAADLVVVCAERPDGVPALTELLRARTSALAPIVERFSEDRAALNRRYDTPLSAERRARLRAFLTTWQARLAELDFNAFDREARIDYILLEHRLRYDLSLLDREERALAEMQPLLPALDALLAMHARWRDRASVDARAAAEALDAATNAVIAARARAADAGVTPIVAQRATQTLQQVRRAIGEWHGFYAAYDPNFTWWTREPHEHFVRELDGYVRHVRERVVGIRAGEPEPIIGDPIGESGLADDLMIEMMPYSVPELIQIAERELAWGEAEMRRAARELGYGDDWQAALEHVKQRHVAAGSQPELVAFLAKEAEDFVEQHELVTVPPLAKEIWRMTMLSPERQRIAPFFLGGEVVQIAFPTDDMTHDEKLMSMRGNNEHFSRAVVHHELIPGHHLQGFMTRRFNAHRGAFATPFWGEGWALYWEFILYDHAFPKTPEDRIGMLFWRNHRAARIIFSLGFHTGRMTPDEAITLLIDRIGHEPSTAEAEVRRSFAGQYSPLYQAAYMVGGLQLRALHRELVESGHMTNREFHDAVLQGGRIPIEMVRARLVDVPLTREYRANWLFYPGIVRVRADN
jgi:uncharacterized protein (DUF885 family)